MTEQANSNKKNGKTPAESSGVIYTGPEVSLAEPFKLSAHDILVKSEDEIKKIQEAKKLASIEQEDASKRETHNLLKQMKIMTAIMLGKDKNKDLSQVLNTDKSFTSKQINELEDQGLITKEVEGREVRYSVNKFNFMKFLQQKVVIKWKSKEEIREEKEKDERGDAEGKKI